MKIECCVCNKSVNENKIILKTEQGTYSTRFDFYCSDCYLKEKGAKE